jgi:hypothetical protein
MIILDPRPTEQDDQIQKIIQAKAEGKITIGLEVTIAAFAQHLDYNIDPQHTDDQQDYSCILACAEGALSKPFSEGDRFAFFTVRPDLDSIGAYVVANWLLQCGESELEHCISPQAYDRIQSVHRVDCFLNSGKWSACELFSEGYERPELAAIARCVSDFKATVEYRVAAMEAWLQYGIEPEGYREAYERDRYQVADAIATGATKAQAYACDFQSGTDWRPVESVNLGGHDRAGYAYVESELRAATSIGYSKAPVVVAYNPEFPDRNLGKVKKFTICQYALGYCDLKEVFARLNEMEAGWGGSPTIGGSPQGVSSALSPEVVCQVVQDCMTI